MATHIKNFNPSPITSDDLTVENNNNNSDNWNPVYSKRSRSSPDQILNIKKRQTHIKDYWLNKPIDLQNQFTPLQADGEKEDGNKVDLKVSTQKSHPIFVSGVEDIGPLKSLLDKIAENNYTLRTLSNNEVKIVSNSSEKYLPIVEEQKKKTHNSLHTKESKIKVTKLC